MPGPRTGVETPRPRPSPARRPASRAASVPGRGGRGDFLGHLPREGEGQLGLRAPRGGRGQRGLQAATTFSLRASCTATACASRSAGPLRRGCRSARTSARPSASPRRARLRVKRRRRLNCCSSPRRSCRPRAYRATNCSRRPPSRLASRYTPVSGPPRHLRSCPHPPHGLYPAYTSARPGSAIPEFFLVRVPALSLYFLGHVQIDSKGLHELFLTPLEDDVRFEIKLTAGESLPARTIFRALVGPARDTPDLPG